MKTLAKDKKGYCLSEVYINNNTKMLWECKKGHIWEARPREIKRGIWCPTCGSNKLTIEEMQRVAHAKHGECLSRVYINTDTKLRWKCENQHIWEAIPYLVTKKGRWCPYCAKN
ncbi:zinc-ribbon domain-containing protein [Bacillus thuringiensis]|nr:zinc-ribbon domain-containing protein [Bacillus thuringiensis]